MRSSGESYRRAARDNNTARSWKSGEIGGGYKQTFSSKQHYLDVSTRYTANRATSLAHSVEREQDLLGMPLLGLPAEMNNNFYNTFRIWIAQADYVQPTAIGKLETGVKSTLRLIDNDTYLDSLNRRTGEYVPNVNAINSFFFSDHVLAGYGMLSTKLMDFNVQAGVRVEHTIVRTEQLTTGERSGTAYTHLFPTLHLSRKLDTANTLQFSYSRRINRPNFWQLNPFVDYSNPALLRKGNPQLLPETIDAVEASWVTQLDKHTVTATGYYRRTTDAMQFYAVVDPSIPPSAGNTLLTFRNFDAVQNMGFEGVYRGQVLPGWTLTGNVNVFYNSIQGGSEVGNISAGRVTYNFRAMSALKMPWEGGNLQVNYMYNGPMVISQGTMDAWHALTLGFRQDVSKELSLTFNVSDVVNTQAFVLRLGDANFHSLVNQKPETRIATLNITYRLGGIQGEQPRRRRDAGDAPQEGGGVGFGF
jgi:outer membrane receptor protein involved in Fe transport